MKKKLFTGIVTLAFAAVVGYNVKMQTNKNQVETLLLSNIEALASNEIIVIECSDEYIWVCKSSEPKIFGRPTEL